MGKSAEWVFQEPPEYGAAGLTGDVVKMFRGELRPLPGFLAERQPGASTTLFVRELIQNSMDAHFEWKKGHSSAARLDMTFEFEELSGRRLDSFVDAAGLGPLSKRSTGEELTGKLGLPEDAWLAEGNTTLPLTILRVTESGTTGMYGPWKRTGTAIRKMVAALLEFGNNEKPVDAGGSYGFGKTGLAKASRARIVIAYTCFEDPAPDNGATRRLYGVAYWGQHKMSEKEFTGFGGLGKPVDEAVAASAGITEPFVDDEADRIAESLGLKVRSVDGELGCGTSFVIIDPDFDAAELKNAIEIYWWPALERKQLWTTIVGKDGSPYPPRPKIDPDLKPFADALEYAEGKTKPPSTKPCDVEDFKYLNKSLGSLGMVIDDTPGSWSFSDDVNDISMAALVRKTGLVIKYETTPTALPKVRGVFSASDDVNDILRLSEPKAHDEWVDIKDSDIPEESRKFAKKAKEDVRRSLRDFASKFAPKIDRPPAVLKEFNSYFAGSKPGGTKPSVPTNDPWKLTFGQSRLESAGDESSVRQLAVVSVRLKDRIDPVEVAVELGFGAMEGDGRFSTLLLDCIVDDAPDGFARVVGATNVFRGMLSSSGDFEFHVRSSDYPADWQCGFEATITPWLEWAEKWASKEAK